MKRAQSLDHIEKLIAENDRLRASIKSLLMPLENGVEPSLMDMRKARAALPKVRPVKS